MSVCVTFCSWFFRHFWQLLAILWNTFTIQKYKQKVGIFIPVSFDEKFLAPFIHIWRMFPNFKAPLLSTCKRWQRCKENLYVCKIKSLWCSNINFKNFKKLPFSFCCSNTLSVYICLHCADFAKSFDSIMIIGVESGAEKYPTKRVVQCKPIWKQTVWKYLKNVTYRRCFFFFYRFKNALSSTFSCFLKFEWLLPRPFSQ